MIEFLEFINAPKQYYIARDLAIYYPLEELLKLIKKCRTEDEAEDLKNYSKLNLLFKFHPLKTSHEQVPAVKQENTNKKGQRIFCVLCPLFLQA